MSLHFHLAAKIKLSNVELVFLVLSAETNCRSKAAFSLVFLMKDVANLIKDKNIFSMVKNALAKAHYCVFAQQGIIKT